MLTVVLAGIFVIFLSHLCSLSEAALLSIPLARARALAKIGGRRARVLLRLREKVQHAISAIVILNTVVNVVGTAVVATAAGLVADKAAARGDATAVTVSLVTAVLTVAIVFFGEIIPKTLGERFHVGVAKAAAYPVLVLVTVMHPVAWLTEQVVDRFAPRRRKVTSEEEIAALVEQASREKAIGSEEAEVIRRVFRLNDITAEDIMTPRIRAHMLTEDLTLAEAREDIGRIAHSRIPLYAGTRDHVTGIVRRAELLKALADGRSAERLAEFSTKAKFVPRTMGVDRLLLDFQKERVQIGVVVGEYGETIGIVTIEDILEELVGEILDEKDVDETRIKRVSREEILVHGQTEVQHVNRFFNTEIPEERPTIAGFLLERLERLPTAGERVSLEGLDFVLDEVTDRAIARVRILKPTPAEK